MRDLCGRCLSFIIPLKDANWNGIGSTTSYCSREDPVGTSRVDSRNREIGRNQAWKQKLSVSFNNYYFECTLNDTLTAKMVILRRQHPKWDRNPSFVSETTTILSTFAYVRVTPRVFKICHLRPFHRRLHREELRRIRTTCPAAYQCLRIR